MDKNWLKMVISEVNNAINVRTVGVVLSSETNVPSQKRRLKELWPLFFTHLRKASYGFIAKLFGVTRAAVLKWIRKEGALIDKPKVPSNIKEMEFDEMWHFIGSKKTNCGSSKPWIVLQEKLSHGCSVVVALQRSESSMIKSVT